MGPWFEQQIICYGVAIQGRSLLLLFVTDFVVEGGRVAAVVDQNMSQKSDV